MFNIDLKECCKIVVCVLIGIGLREIIGLFYNFIKKNKRSQREIVANILEKSKGLTIEDRKAAADILVEIKELTGKNIDNVVNLFKNDEIYKDPQGTAGKEFMSKI